MDAGRKMKPMSRSTMARRRQKEPVFKNMPKRRVVVALLIALIELGSYPVWPFVSERLGKPRLSGVRPCMEIAQREGFSAIAASGENTSVPG